jgi:hypothetical protein
MLSRHGGMGKRFQIGCFPFGFLVSFQSYCFLVFSRFLDEFLDPSRDWKAVAQRIIEQGHPKPGSFLFITCFLFLSGC